MKINSLLVVCRGNICRSPMAQGYLSHHLKEKYIEVASAGISAVIDHPADKNALKIMQQHNIDISAHRARQLTFDIVRKADLILVMSYSQLKTVVQNFVVAKGKTFLLGHWKQEEIADPHMQSFAIFEKTYQRIELACQDWKTRIFGCQITYA